MALYVVGKYKLLVLELKGAKPKTDEVSGEFRTSAHTAR
jgi:hypothetical protein